MFAIIIPAVIAILIFFHGTRYVLRIFTGILAATLIMQFNWYMPVIQSLSSQELRAIAVLALFALIAYAVSYISSGYTKSYGSSTISSKTIASIIFGITLGGLIIALGKQELGFGSVIFIPSQVSMLFTNGYAVIGWLLATIVAMYFVGD